MKRDEAPIGAERWIIGVAVALISRGINADAGGDAGDEIVNVDIAIRLIVRVAGDEIAREGLKRHIAAIAADRDVVGLTVGDHTSRAHARQHGRIRRRVAYEHGEQPAST